MGTKGVNLAIRSPKNRISRSISKILIVVLVSFWSFTGWPQIFGFPPEIQKAYAAVAYQGKSLSAAASTGADVTPALPTHQADDIFLLQVLVRDVDDTLTVSGWTQIATIDEGTTARHWWYWKRATSSSESNPVVDKSGSTGDTYASVTSYRGAATSGDPWEVKGTASCTGTADPFSLNGISTLTDGSLVVASWNDRDNAVNSATYSATDPSVLTSNMHHKSAVGADGLNSSGSAVRTSSGATGNVSVNPSKTPDGVCGIVLALKPYIAIDVTIADGTDPSNSTVAPGSGITDLGAFTLEVNSGSDSATAATVTLADGTYAGLSEIRITSSDGTTTYFSAVTNPSANVVNFSGGTAIPISTSGTTFKIRVTPKTHTNMPTPVGSEYAVAGTITSLTTTNTQLGSDTDSATITIDNLSTANTTSNGGSAGNAEVTIDYTTPADTDLHSVIVLRDSSAVSDNPVEGATYTVGNTINTATVACVDTGVAVSTVDSCTDTDVINGTAYHYEIFVKDDNGNYSTGIVPTGSPFTPSIASSTFTLNDYRWYVDDDTANPSAIWGNPDLAENTAIAAIPADNDPPDSSQELRLRTNFTVNTANLSATSRQFKLQFKTGTDGDCTTGSWTDVGTSQTWEFATSSVSDGTLITASLAASEIAGQYAKSNPTITNTNSATMGQEIEYDFHIIGTNIADATQYSFRVIESDSSVFDAYTTCPTLRTEPSMTNFMRHGNFFTPDTTVEAGLFWVE